LKRIWARRTLRVLIAAAIAAAVAAGATYATTSLSGSAAATSTIQACVKDNGDLHIVASTTECKRGERPLTWNVVGPQGVPGPQGEKGDDGLSVQTTALAAGDANCPFGGSSFTVGTAPATFACNGAKGDAGKDGASPTSIDDLAGLACTNGGIAGAIAVSYGPGGVVTLTCSNPSTDAHNCGTPGNDVSRLPNATGGCRDGTAYVVACDPGYTDSDGLAVDGCEAAAGATCPHDDGIGQTYQDCVDQPGLPGNAQTYNDTMARLAASSWNPGHTTHEVLCGGSGGDGEALWTATDTQAATWTFTGPYAGFVHLSNDVNPVCPTFGDAVWH
jgi:hypothetical protein